MGHAERACPISVCPSRSVAFWPWCPFPSDSGKYSFWQGNSQHRTYGTNPIFRVQLGALRSSAGINTTIIVVPDATLLEAPRGEENRISVLWPLDAGPLFPGPHSVRRLATVHGIGGRRRGAGLGWGLFPGAPLRAPAGLALSTSRRRRRAHQEDRNRDGGHRHALREPDVHG